VKHAIAKTARRKIANARSAIATKPKRRLASV
jgi:hypothetical protein